MLTVRNSRYSGKMTDGSRKRLTRAITLMCQAWKPRWIENPIKGHLQWHHITFITLTVSDTENISASWAQKHLLSHFLQWLRRTKEVSCYVWKAELQKRGQIHYHIILPEFIPYGEIRKKWNTLQREAGILEKFAKKYGHFKPPSTEIRAVKHVKNISSYIIKELAKSVDAIEVEITAEVTAEIEAGTFPEYLKKEEIRHRLKNKVELDGKTWDTSDNLGKGKYFTVEINLRHIDLLQQWEREGLIKLKGDLFEDWWSVVIFQGKSPPDLLSGLEKKLLTDHLNQIMQS